MLKFESLELIGFKSFADKTRVVFDDRVTAVVGPNGCGKSNMADAISWALGLQSARGLRGEKMEDVIFAGTTRRKSSGVAQVTLTVCRTDDSPIVLNGEELVGDRLEITRKLYRSGESVYLINQRRRRLKDIHLFMQESSLGLASYALIAQGTMDSFLTSKPMDRRTVIEEAAGIAGYKSRRRSAEVKLEMAQQNLVRVTDIVTEVERQLRSLKRQAAKARRYRELKEEFRVVQRQKFALEARELGARIEKLEGDLEQLTAAEESLLAQLNDCEQRHRRSLEQRDQFEKRLAQLREERASLRLEIDRTENSIQYQGEQIESLRRQLENNSAEEKMNEQSLTRVQEELARFHDEERQLQLEDERVRAALQEQGAVVERYRQDLHEGERHLEDLRNQYLRASSEVVSLRNLKEQTEQRVNSVLTRRERLEKEKAAHTLKWEESKDALLNVQEQGEEKEEQLNSLKAVLEEQEEERDRLEQELTDISSQTAEIQKQLIASQERLHSLQEVEVNHSNYSEGVQQFLNHVRRSQGVRTGGTLADFVETSPEYERLVEEFLNEELEYILVDSFDEALRGISELKSLKSGRCTFLSLNSSNGFGDRQRPEHNVEPRQDDGVHGRLRGLLKMKPDVQDAFQRILPERASAIVVSDLDRAFEMAHQYPQDTFVTLEGEAWTPQGLLSGTTLHSKKLGLLNLKRQKRDLEKRLQQLNKSMAILESRQEQTDDKLEVLQTEQAENQDERHNLEKEIIGLSHQEEKWSVEERRQKQALRVVEEELTQLDVEQKAEADKIERLEKQIAERQGAQLDAEGLMAEGRKSLEQLRIEFERVQEQFHVMSSDQKVMEERKSALGRTLRRIEEQRKGLDERQANVRSARQEGEKRLETSISAREDLQAELQERRGEEARTSALLTRQEGEYNTWKTSYPRLEERLGELRDRRMKLQQDNSRVQVDKARLETQLENLGRQCQENLLMPLVQVQEETDTAELTLAEISEPYEQLKGRLDSFGPVNMTALEEYQENEERYEFLTGQRQDIETSIADASRAIQEINRRSRERFREAFQAINTHFKEVFTKLFGGGECGMRLLDEEDLLESGIDIYAQPPGKRLQNVMLLSGGEKAMTVLALLVGIFNYRPSQFCVFDEVDAPLDDANVTRFTNLVKEMSANTQFIIITHNKKTMEIASAIYGVTMQEAGVSQVVSVNFNDHSHRLVAS